MADRGKKEPTPPPLLLMPAGGGLTLNPPEQDNMLMPVIQSEPSLFGPEDEGLGEADSFVGQSPPSSNTSSTADLFSSKSGGIPNPSDPFSQIGRGTPPPPPGQQRSVGQEMPQPPAATTSHQNMFGQVPLPSGPFQPASTPLSAPGAGIPPKQAGTGSNMFRKQGPLKKYAQPPPGTYAQEYGSPSSLMSAPPAPIPFSQTFQQTAMMEPSNIGQQQIESPYGQPPPQATAPPPPTIPQFGPGGLQVGMQGLYCPVQHHWCYCKVTEGKERWYPFSHMDSARLEDTYNAAIQQDPDNVIVATDGGRYDVDLNKRKRYAVYWEEDAKHVHRCSWFFKREGDNRYVPYDEETAGKLEEEFKNAITTGVWHKRLEFPGGETVVMHNPNVMVHYQPSSQPDEWGTVQGDQMRPRVVKRGVEDFESIEEGEPIQIDHLVFVVHGIGPICDARFRDIVECVDDFRTISLSLLKSHFTRHMDEKRIGRVEFLPVHWHKALHGDATGIDRHLKAITLPSTGKLRHFVNDTLLDVLFYTSPIYCQWIIDTVGSEMNRLYQLFMERNPQFQGAMSVAGHSLGSSIVFDLLSNQSDSSSSVDAPVNGHVDAQPDLQENQEPPPVEEEFEDDQKPEMTLEELLAKVGLQDKVELFTQEQIDMESLIMCSEADLKDLGLPMGPRKKLQGILREEQQNKDKRKQQAERKLREETERKVREKLLAEAAAKKQEQSMGENALPRTSSITVQFIKGPAGTGQPSVTYPRLKFNPMCCFALGSPIGIFLSARGLESLGDEFKLPTCQKFYNIFHPFDPVAYRLEPFINPAASHIKPVLMPHHKGRKRLHLELKESLTRVGADIKQKIMESLKSTWNSISEFAKAHQSNGGVQMSLEEQVDREMSSLAHDYSDDKSDTASFMSHEEDVYMGQLNDGGRIDYVLQERPIESFNDYVFSLASHGCYWNSEDTVLLVLKEIYGSFGIAPQMPGPEGPQKSIPQYKAPPMGPPPIGPPPISDFSQNATVSSDTVAFSSPVKTFSGQPAQGINMGPPVGMNMGPPQGMHMGAPQQNMGMGPPLAQPGGNVGPPPMTGFVRKS